MNATTGQPSGNDLTGYPCPMGSYCEEGTKLPIPCPPGTYGNETEYKGLMDCQQCPPGLVCKRSGLVEPDDICAAGHYCPSGSNETSVNPCPPGYRCPEGSGYIDECPSGQYQDQFGQPDCLICPEGFFCNSKLEPVTNFNKYECPQGYFCPAGTKYAEEFPCPIGMLNFKNNLKKCISKLYQFYLLMH